ncbi:MAG: exodeoxyribonuclease I [Gammaproteobacteria bacterium]|nr:exodeoxyribonuclease I [Gammaproteobacteria bacterium]
MSNFTFYWHDYETFGANPRIDLPVQFAGIRTDAELNPIGEPLMVYSRPSSDYLPQPGACMVTGITPQLALEKGVPEVEFIQQIMQELGKSDTCGVGYNTLRFDDEVTRNTLYRNLYDPYEREWKNGSSRWDIIDLLRLTRALRPEGIEWPFYEDGKPSMRLEHLTAANGIDHGMAHDALADVHATIAMARLVKEKNPKLYHYVLSHKDKKSAATLLNMSQPTPLLHVSSMIPSERSNLAIIIPVARHPTNSNGIIVYDLHTDPTPFLTLSAEEIQQRLFTRNEDLPEGVSRVPLKTVHLNKCPVLAPLNTLDAASQERLQIDLNRQQQHAEILRNAPHFSEQVVQAHLSHSFPEEQDPDRMIYSGFFDQPDKQQMRRIHTLTPQQLGAESFHFQDPRLEQMLFRYRARNWPDSLNEAEQQRWLRFCQHRIMDEDGGGSLHYNQFQTEISTLVQEHANNPEKLQVLQALAEYGDSLLNQ